MDPVHREAAEAIGRLHTFIEQPDVQEVALQRQAVQAAHYLGKATPDGQPWLAQTEELEDNTFNKLIDPSQPTLGLRPDYTMFSAPVLAHAASRLRQAGEQICNVVLLPPYVSGQHTGESTYTAVSGVLIDKAGVAHHGQFPQPVPIDTGFAIDPDLAISLNSHGTEAVLDDKLLTHRALEAAAIPRPELLDVFMHDDQAALKAVLERSVRTGQAIVIKPAHGLQGRDVIIFDPLLDDASSILPSFASTGGPSSVMLVEALMKSYALPHAESGIRLDWNIRDLLIGGMAIGGYVRAGSVGGPINIARGAKALPLKATLEQAGLSRRQMRSLQAQLNELRDAVAGLLPSAYLGLDIIINENLQPNIIELNGERSGGLENLIRHGVPQAGLVAMRALHHHVFTKGRPGPSSLGMIDTADLHDYITLLRYQLPDHVKDDLAAIDFGPGVRRIAPSVYEPDGATLDMELLDRYANQRPRVLEHQRQCADLLSATIDAPDYRLALRLISADYKTPAEARNYARALFFNVADDTKADLSGVDMTDYRQTVEALAAEFIKPLAERDYSQLLTKVVAMNHLALFRIVNRTAKLHLTASGDYDALMNHLTDELEHNAVFDTTFDTYLLLHFGETCVAAGKELDVEMIQCIFMACLMAGRLARATGYLYASGTDRVMTLSDYVSYYGSRAVIMDEPQLDRTVGMTMFHHIMLAAAKITFAGDLTQLNAAEELLRAVEVETSLAPGQPFQRYIKDLSGELAFARRRMV